MNLNEVPNATPTDQNRSAFKPVPVWQNIIVMLLIHALAIYGFFLVPSSKPWTILFGYLIMILGTLGVQAGAHRLWAHRCYKANFAVRLILMIFQTMALQNDIYEWSRDHRAHHKWSDTDADPHNASRGFFFSHVGWLLVKKHPDVKRKGSTLDMSDLKADRIVMFQRTFYIPLLFIFWFGLPSWIPVYFWNESWLISIITCVFMRYVVSLNLTWFVNSWAHFYGSKPYDQGIVPVEASIRNILFGEGFHNYHHTFPWDYSASELGAADVFNPATAFIDLFHWLGWAWDLKKVNLNTVKKRADAAGDSAVQYKLGTGMEEWRQGLVTTLVFPMVLLFSIKYLFG